MDVLSSTLCNSKQFLSCPLPKKQQLRLCIDASYRATKLAGENEASKDFYKVLSLSGNGESFDEIKRIYRRMALRYHPDVCPPSLKKESTRIFVQLHAAYKTLSDPILREEYDGRFDSRNFRRTSEMDIGDCAATRNRWRGQILELKRRSSCRMEEMEGSWGSRMRAQKKRTEE